MNGNLSGTENGQKNNQISTKFEDKPLGWIALLLFVFVGSGIIWSVSCGWIPVTQGLIVVEMGLVLFGGARLTGNFSHLPTGKGSEQEEEKSRSTWLTRIGAVSSLGLGGIVLYAIQYDNWGHARVLSFASMGLMASGAAWLTGALLGFLFGVPHVRSDDQKKATEESPASPE